MSKTPFGIYGYAPKAPSVKISESEYGILLEEITLAVKPFLPPQTICIRFDTIWKSPYVNSEIQQGNESQTSRTDSTGEIPRNEIRELRMNYGTQTHLLKKTKRNHFCPDTVIINLQHSPEQLLCNMRQTTRNCVRRSYRENVIFSEKSTDFLPKWYDLYRSTGERKKFYTEKMDYFVQLINRHEEPGRIFFKPVASPHEDCGKDLLHQFVKIKMIIKQSQIKLQKTFQISSFKTTKIEQNRIQFFYQIQNLCRLLLKFQNLHFTFWLQKKTILYYQK